MKSLNIIIIQFYEENKKFFSFMFFDIFAISNFYGAGFWGEIITQIIYKAWKLAIVDESAINVCEFVEIWTRKKSVLSK